MKAPSRRALAFRLYREEHLTPAQVAERMGIGLPQAVAYRRESGIAYAKHPPPVRRLQAVALLNSGKSLAEVAEIMHTSRDCVSAHRRFAGLPPMGRKRRYTTADKDSRAGLPTCWCGLLLPCTCTGPARAEQFMGRRDEPRISSGGL